MSASPDRNPHSVVFISTAEVGPLCSGKLDGWRFAVKDNIDVAGLRTTGGTRILNRHVAREDATVVHRLREAGARIVGKTNMHELGHGITGINPTFGVTHHPDNPAFTVGGSSGGSALAVALGTARAALGTDTGGSVRIPAAYTGLIGYRPSRGRYPTAGVVRISTTRDTVGVIARSVEDVVAVDEVLRSAPAVRLSDGVSTVGVLRESIEALAPGLRVQFERALEAIEIGGVRIRRLDVSRKPDRHFSLGITVLGFETVRALEDYLQPLFGTDGIAALIDRTESSEIRELLESVLEQPVGEAEYRTALREIEELERTFREHLWSEGIETIVYPTTSSEPPQAVNRDEIDSAAELEITVLNSTPATLAGTPAISLPSGRSATTGLPAGLTLEHLGRDDDALLSLATRIESILAGRAPDSAPAN